MLKRLKRKSDARPGFRSVSFITAPMRKRNKPEVVKVGKYYRLTAIIDGRVEYMYTNSLKVVDIYRMAFKPPTRALFILFAEVADALPDYCGARWAYAKTEALNTLYRNLCSN